MTRRLAFFSDFRHIPTIIIHGRKDMVCPVEAGVSLHKALPEAEFVLLDNAGHIAQGDEMVDALITATDKMADKLSEPIQKN